MVICPLVDRFHSLKLSDSEKLVPVTKRDELSPEKGERFEIEHTVGKTAQTAQYVLRVVATTRLTSKNVKIKI